MEMLPYINRLQYILHKLFDSFVMYFKLENHGAEKRPPFLRQEGKKREERWPNLKRLGAMSSRSFQDVGSSRLMADLSPDHVLLLVPLYKLHCHLQSSTEGSSLYKEEDPSAQLSSSSSLSETLHLLFRNPCRKLLIEMAACLEQLTSGMAAKPLPFNLDRPLFADPSTIYKFVELSTAYRRANNEENRDDLWLKMREEAWKDVEKEPVLGSYYISSILAYDSLESALATHLGYRLATPALPGHSLAEVFLAAFLEDRSIRAAVRADMRAIRERDSACVSCWNFRDVSEVRRNLQKIY